MRRSLISAGLLVCLGGHPAAADEHPLPYVGLSVGGHIALTDIDLGELDRFSRPIPIESSLYTEARLGLDLTTRWSVEVAAGHVPFGASIETNDGLDIALRARWAPIEAALRPYAVLGGGVYVNLQPDPGGASPVFAPQGHYGLGLGPRLLDVLRLRVEVRHQLTDGIGDDIGMALVAIAGVDVLPTAGAPAPEAPTDRDGDGVPDERDGCPEAAGDPPDGCPAPADGDGDGVPDEADRCPEATGDLPDGCPAPADGDGDGVPDERDRCPDAPGEAPDGCPPPPSPVGVTIDCDRIEVGDVVLFDSGRYRIRSEAAGLLEGVARTLQEHPEIRRVRVTGFTDSAGSSDFNARLSLQRAWVVRQALVAHGVERSRVVAVGFGERSPRASNATGDGRRQNRRVEFTITAAEARPGCAERGGREP